jgi:ribosomal protein S13
MIRNCFEFFNKLVINKKTLLIITMMLFGVGTYTFSEITTDIDPIKKYSDLQHESVKTINFNIPVYRTQALNLEANLLVEKGLELQPSEDIMDTGNIDELTLMSFLLEHNSELDTKYAQKIANIYKSEADHEGVNSDLAFTQMCLETGFLKFGGDVDQSQNNFCGLGATGNGVKGLSFANPEEGIRAHIQHLKAYGSTKSLKKDLVDTRFRFVNRGSGVELSDLTGKWAADKNYDIKIRNLMSRLYSMTNK